MRLRTCGPPLARALTAVLTIALLGGCASTGQDPADDPFSARSRDGPVRIEIQSDHFDDARIYADWNGTRRRVGLAVGSTVSTLELQWMALDLRIEVNLIAAGGFVTEPEMVWPGETIYLRIPGIGDGI